MTTVTTTEITNTEDIIDSRDVIARIEYLEDTLCPADESDGTDNEERSELAALVALRDEDSPDWPHGETLIRDSYFQDYAEQMAEDIGAIDSNASWPNNCIDWERATRELQYDYSCVEFGGVNYWIRG